MARFMAHGVHRVVNQAPFAVCRPMLIIYFPMPGVECLFVTGPKIVFSDTKCAVGNSECVVGIYLMCSSILRKPFEIVATRCYLLRRL